MDGRDSSGVEDAVEGVDDLLTGPAREHALAHDKATTTTTLSATAHVS